MQEEGEYSWDLDPPEGWVVVGDFFTGASQPKFVSANQRPERIMVRYFCSHETKRARCHVRYGRECQGPPSHVHGGATAALLDELMGLTCWSAAHTVVAATLSFTYAAPTPLHTELIGEGWIDHLDGNKVYVKCELKTVEGGLCVSGEGLFLDLPPERFAKLAK